MRLKSEDLEIPFDEVYLPSGGFFYSDKRPSLLVRYLTAREENVLTSPSLAASGKALDIVLNSVIIGDEIDVGSLLVGDKNALLLYLRSTSYGDKCTMETQCPGCSVKSSGELRLSELGIKETTILPDANGLYHFQMPKMRIFIDGIPGVRVITEKTITNKVPIVVTFKPLTVNDELELNRLIDEEAGEYKRKITQRYRTQIKAINGCQNQSFIDAIIKGMPILDSMKLRTFMDEVEPGIQREIPFECESCGHEYNEEFIINNDFFGLSQSYRKNMMEQIFLLEYYGKGVNRSDAYKMTVSERAWRIERISEEVDKKNKAEQKAVDNAKRKK